MEVGLEQVNLDVDISPRGFGVRTRFLRALRDRLRLLPVYTRKADIETRLEEISIIAVPKLHFGIDEKIGRQSNLPLPGALTIPKGG